MILPEPRMHGSRSATQALGDFAPLQQKVEIVRCHEVGFYSEGTRLLDDLTQFVKAALNAGNAAIVVAIQSHRDSLLPRLQANGVDIAAAIEQGRYIGLDAADALPTFTLSGMPDPVRFLKVLGEVISTAAKAVNGKTGSRCDLWGNVPSLVGAR